MPNYRLDIPAFNRGVRRVLTLEPLRREFGRLCASLDAWLALPATNHHALMIAMLIAILHGMVAH